jgi:hypothetical protein
MNIFKPFLSGLSRALRSWKWIVIIWLFTLILVSMLVMPFKASISAALGRSMITEKLAEGINIDVIADLGSNFTTIFSSISTGLFLLLFFGFLINIFLNGGLFSSLKTADSRFTSGQFFGRAGESFWSFLVITIIMALIIFLFALLIIGIPLAIVGGSQREGAIYKTFIFTGIIFLIILPVFLLVADYARAWQAGNSTPACFKAIGAGFTQTFRHFFSSYPLMAVLMIIQFLFAWLVFCIISGMKPATGAGLLLLFLLTQLFFIIKLLLRTWRYGCVTSMLEQHP